MDRNFGSQRQKSQAGASLLESGLIIALVLMVSITAIPSLRYKIEAYTWLVSLAFSDNEQILPDGSRYYTTWVPEGAFRTWSTIIPNGPWCYVKLYSDPKGLPPGHVVTSGDIQECRDAPL